MDTLMDTPCGAYTVETTSATYNVDLDRMFVRRFPRTSGHEAADLRCDGEELRLLFIHDCTVGREFAIFVDLGSPGVLWTLRCSTPVRSIAPFDAAAERQAVS